MKMKRTAVISTKGGVGKTTVAVNLGALCADAGLRTLLIDLDPAQPSASSYYPLVHEAEGGIYDLIALNITDPARVISTTSIPNLSLILSNDPNNQLINLLLQAPDGRLRLAQLLQAFEGQFDLVIIDTQGARSVLLEMVLLASDLAVSPLPPNMLSAREFSRGLLQTLDGLQTYKLLGLNIPLVKVIINSLDQTNDARAIHESIRCAFQDSDQIEVLRSTIPVSVKFREASTHGIPIHHREYRKPSNKQGESALSVFRELAIELFPEWLDRFEALTEEAVKQLVKAGFRP
jgi:chromosome partitioning related protein ParA